MWIPDLHYSEFIIRAAVVYISVLLLLRLGGKREIGQMGAGEFVAILLISNAVQNSMNGGDNSITGGLILASVIIALSLPIAYLSFKSKKLENIIQGTPRLLIHNGQVLSRNLDKELLNLSELQTILRRQGIHDLNEVAEAVLESNGYVSVTRKPGQERGPTAERAPD